MTTTALNNALPLTKGTWHLDPAHTSVGFTVWHLGLSRIRGRFDGFIGEVTVGEDLASSSVTATIDLSTVSTGSTERDNHLKSSDFFNVEKDPTMNFKSTSIAPDGGNYRLGGELTINSVTEPVTLDVEFFGTSANPMDQSPRAGFAATGALSRKDFGIDFNMPGGADAFVISDTVTLELDVQLTSAD